MKYVSKIINRTRAMERQPTPGLGLSFHKAVPEYIHILAVTGEAPVTTRLYIHLCQRCESLAQSRELGLGVREFLRSPSTTAAGALATKRSLESFFSTDFLKPS